MWLGRLSLRQAQGQDWEQAALAYLKRHKLTPVEQNFRCKAGEIDLIMRDGASLVFVEVRQRSGAGHGGAAASITPAKIRRLTRAAQVYLLRFPVTPPCRFDVIAIDGERISWLKDVIN
ncbi:MULTISPECIES: YraN family protein [unclassified Massilia]|uniref:YraN family protein n=1 Tax=unclassified Massilia TaxID=2609279 RepID=UPI001B81311D|nr:MULTISPECIES: YraN family protein [unclassified Massilia]MBQ5938741.1 YraN family protein [Massilia sp. AB1]MBQ5962206.1 YraN family protein [Massilia sp. ZL223]